MINLSKTRILVAGCFILFLFLVGNPFSFRFLRACVTVPSFSLLRLSSFFLNDLIQFSRRGRLIEENRLLKKNVATLQKESSLLREKFKETKRMEGLLALATPPEVTGIFCRIVGRDPSHWSQMIILDGGKKEGLKEDMAVLGTQGLVGRVVEVEEDWSRVLLITAPDSKVAALLERSREIGLLVGESRGLLLLEYLSPGADIREGDKVLTAGFGEIFPKGITIGEVVGFGRREEDLLMYALVKPAEHLSQLEEVLCVQR